MGPNHVVPGLLLLAATLAYFSVKYARAPKKGSFPAWGWVGLLVVLVAEFLLFRGVAWVETYFTPLAWTGYLLFMDALVSSLRGQSRLRQSPAQFLRLAFWSVPLWLIFEAYNLRLQNWAYTGLPANPLERGFGYCWAFATIWPAIFETADFTQSLGTWRNREKRPIRLGPRPLILICTLGLLMVVLPVALPVHIGQYLFGAVWVGFILLLDPINYYRNRQSLLRDWETGQTSRIYSLLVAGWVCGIVWEFWNYWSGAKWVYVFPIGQNLKVFAMPFPGYFGFLPFALECFVMYEFLGTLRRDLRRARSEPMRVGRFR